MSFTHLHVHSHYSILDGMSKIPDLVEKAAANGMNAIALTDHGNMFGIKELLDYVHKRNQKSESDQKFKPIVGVEAYCARRSLYKKELKEDGSGWHLILLAKNKTGYRNLCKIVSTAWIDGYYYRPRIDKNILEKYKEGLIVSSACIGGEIPQHILNNRIDDARQSIAWFKEQFNDDFYLEIQRHKTNDPTAAQDVYEKQKKINNIILQLAEETDTKVIATNDVHFVEKEHAEAHDRLICLSTGKNLNDEKRMRYTKQEWLKTPEEMSKIFEDIPFALDNTAEIVDKIEFYSIDSAPIMPIFDIPIDFGTEEEYRKKFTKEQLFDEFTQNEKGETVLNKEQAEKKIKTIGGYDRLYRIKLEADYLTKLTWEGAKKRYIDLTDTIKERIVFELYTMKTMGFPGYFLIVQDFIQAARDMGVSVGPGRGSAAGSVVAYCLKITDIDPLKYDLLFERFLNPDRISLPDIDIDFDDDGRGDVLSWVTEKYGKEKVAHIITYGTMATKSSIADVGRVQEIPLPEVNALKNYIPDKFEDKKLEDPKTGKMPKVNVKNCIKYIPDLHNIAESPSTDNEKKLSDVLKYASMLEGTVRQTGVHACGVIIGADDLTKFVPLSTAKEKGSNEDVLVTQYEGSVIESVGLIKMDFLGLKTLSIIKETLNNIEKSKGESIDISQIPIDDALTFQLYCNGQTIGTFQFESPGMQKYLKELQPSTFEDLIAMNALYRPGPMEYIPKFINRKHGKEPILYDIDIMEKYLKDTYGITVYQEQVMLLSRLLADFTRGESDTLRKAMGKKQKDKLDHMKPDFIERGTKNGYDPKILEKIWSDWEKFASYAFNKSHATCYSWISYQTAYLKAHYPAEFMAANLTRNKDNIDEITKFMSECKSMKLDVKGPDINESELTFTVNKTGEIRFGLGGIKGVGEGAVEAIIEERRKNGTFRNIFDFVERVNLSTCNRKALESLAWSGAFDSLNINREQFFAPHTKGNTTLDALIQFGNRYQEDQRMNKNSLFGDLNAVEIAKPEIPKTESMAQLDKLNKERDLIGIYLSSHPLDRYRIALEYGCSCTVTQLAKMFESGSVSNFSVGGIVVSAREGLSQKNNQPFGLFTIEDYSGKFEFRLFGKDYINFSKFLKKDIFLFIKGNIQNRTWGNGIEIKINNIDLLEDIHESLIQKITIKIPLKKINSLSNTDLTSLIENSKGQSELFFDIIDSGNTGNISMRSKYRVQITGTFINRLKEMELSFFVN